MSRNSFISVDVLVRGEVLPMRFPVAVVEAARSSSHDDPVLLMERLDNLAEAMMDAAETIARHYLIEE